MSADDPSTIDIDACAITSPDLDTFRLENKEYQDLPYVLVPGFIPPERWEKALRKADELRDAIIRGKKPRLNLVSTVVSQPLRDGWPAPDQEQELSDNEYILAETEEEWYEWKRAVNEKRARKAAARSSATESNVQPERTKRSHAPRDDVNQASKRVETIKQAQISSTNLHIMQDKYKSPVRKTVQMPASAPNPITDSIPTPRQKNPASSMNKSTYDAQVLNVNHRIPNVQDSINSQATGSTFNQDYSTKLTPAHSLEDETESLSTTQDLYASQNSNISVSTTQYLYGSQNDTNTLPKGDSATSYCRELERESENFPISEGNVERPRAHADNSYIRARSGTWDFASDDVFASQQVRNISTLVGDDIGDAYQDNPYATTSSGHLSNYYLDPYGD